MQEEVEKISKEIIERLNTAFYDKITEGIPVEFATSSSRETSKAIKRTQTKTNYSAGNIFNRITSLPLCERLKNN